MLLERFQENALARPDRLAVVSSERKLSYGELSSLSGKLASFLLSREISRGSIVAVFLPRIADVIVCMLGIGAAGAAYTVIEDDGDTVENRKRVVEFCPDLILTAGSHDEYFRNMGHATINIQAEMGHLPAADPDLSVSVDSGDRAYILHTSGSTGKPKGVIITHGNIEHYVVSLLARLDIYGPLSYAHVSSLSADLGNTSLFPPLWTGGSIHLISDDVRKDARALFAYLFTKKINVLKITPSHWNAVFSASGGGGFDDSALRYLILGGELLTPRLAAETLKSGVTDKLVNHYGPTETTIGAAAAVYSDEADIHALKTKSVPFGKPLGRNRFLIGTGGGRYVAGPAVGELYIGGPGVADGYLGDPDLTRAAFLDTIEGNDIFYRTGDFVRIDETGATEYLGRSDRQVKIHGRRIELEYIEHAARRLKGVLEAAAIMIDVGAVPSLALVVRSEVEFTLPEIKARLSEFLPTFALPARIVSISTSLPRNDNGKTDLKAVRALIMETVTAGPAAVDQAIGDDLAQEIASIWRKFLGHNNFSLDSDFFNEVGAGSLEAIQVISEIQARGFDLSTASFLSRPTIRGIAEKLSQPPDPEYQPLAEQFDRKAFRNLSGKPADGENQTPRSYKYPLITGATGHIGVYLLRLFLTRTEAHVHCLIRDRPDQAAADRLKAIYNWYFPREDLEEYSGRLTIIAGSASEPEYGLAPAQYAQLCESVDAIFDLAADTRLFGQSDSFQKANVAAVRNAITMCATGRAKDLHYVSTLAVSGVNLSASPVQFSEADLDIGQEFRNEYERSKFIAEQWVHEFMASGGTGFIYRAGHVSADSCTGKFRQDFGHNRMVQILRAIIKIGKLPARLDMVQALSAVDEVASGIFELARAAQASPGTYHVDGGNEITYRDIITQLQELGYSFEASDYNTFADLFESHSRTGDPDIALGYFWSRRRPRNLKLDCSRTLELLRPMGVVFTPFDADLLRRFLSQLVRVGAFDFDISPAKQRKETGN